MKAGWIPALAAFAVLTILAAGRLASQGKDEEKKKKEQEAFQAYATPGKEHQFLAKRAGKWDYRGRMWMAPGAPPSETKGKSEFKLMMGGRFLVDDTEGDGIAEFGGMPFQGHGFTGFDNHQKKYTSAWIDNLGTAILHLEGELSADGKELSFTGEQPDFVAGGRKTVRMRTVERILSDDRFTFEVHVPGPDGKEFKNFELEYTRRK